MDSYNYTPRTWLAQQPPVVERRSYETPAGVRRRPEDVPRGLTCEEHWKKLDEARGAQDTATSAQVDRILFNYCASDTSTQIASAACLANAVSIGTSSETGLHGMETTDTRSGSERSSTNTDPRIAVDDIWRASDLIGTLRQQAEQVRALSARPDLIQGTFLDGMGGATEPVYVTVAGLQEFDEEISNNSLANDPLDDLRLRYIASANALISSEEASDEFEHEGTEVHFEDYAHELAFCLTLRCQH
ncbi:unnamed protein product [Phytophthora lilii]|uniref:Unnamed protein product n=1 Tax=Phytophthora lilii TaxID=2077276 RepID=A0A9W7CTB2_9STRA|nr:unnamed protein product [Phytophthora lilii]